MPYEPEGGRLLPLVPLGLSSAVCTALVVAKLSGSDPAVAGDLGPASLGIWMFVLLIQGAATIWLRLAARILSDRGVSSSILINTLCTLFAATGAAAFWWASPVIGAVCGLVTLIGVLVSDHLQVR
jgi:hypothetical protein